MCHVPSSITFPAILPGPFQVPPSPWRQCVDRPRLLGRPACMPRGSRPAHTVGRHNTCARARAAALLLHRRLLGDGGRGGRGGQLLLRRRAQPAQLLPQPGLQPVRARVLLRARHRHHLPAHPARVLLPGRLPGRQARLPPRDRTAGPCLRPRLARRPTRVLLPSRRARRRARPITAWPALPALRRRLAGRPACILSLARLPGLQGAASLLHAWPAVPAACRVKLERRAVRTLYPQERTTVVCKGLRAIERQLPA